ncbi:MAG: hypothetical protein AMXMBFR82_42290 [Candidatus Hydrogenedentota bacterium]
MSNAKSKSFDCVASMRQIRDRLSEEIADLTYDELTEWLRRHEYSDPTLQRLAKKAAPHDGGAAPNPRWR